VDPGVDDKRLLVCEGEFANALKVLPREGNTLSPVIRNAWDRGDLQFLTKSKQTRATDVHISLVGHITIGSPTFSGSIIRYFPVTRSLEM
jgi:hypothetical protein